MLLINTVTYSFSPDKPIIVKALPSTNLESLWEFMKLQSRCNGKRVISDFNGFLLDTSKYRTAREMLKKYRTTTEPSKPKTPKTRMP